MHKKIDKDELIHKSYLFEVRRLDLKMDDGKIIQRDTIVHPGAALVVPVLADGSVVMIRNYRYPIGDYLWELPCGTLDDGEEPQVCAERELTEETGYVAGKIEQLGMTYSCPGYTNEAIYSYLATDLKPGSQELEDYEDIAVEIVSQENLRAMVADNTIRDAKTIAALSLYWMKQNS